MNLYAKIIFILFILIFVACSSKAGKAGSLTGDEKALYESLGKDSMSHGAKMRVVINSRKIKEQNNKIEALSKDITILASKIEKIERDIGDKILSDVDTPSGIKKINEQLEFFNPVTFSLKQNANIIGNIHNKEDIVYSWKKGTNFTSFSRFGNWYKISGYFVGSSWKKSSKDIWIENIYIKKIY
jgi:hypothetical protein